MAAPQCASCGVPHAHLARRVGAAGVVVGGADAARGAQVLDHHRVAREESGAGRRAVCGGVGQLGQLRRGQASAPPIRHESRGDPAPRCSLGPRGLEMDGFCDSLTAPRQRPDATRVLAVGGPRVVERSGPSTLGLHHNRTRCSRCALGSVLSVCWRGGLDEVGIEALRGRGGETLNNIQGALSRRRVSRDLTQHCRALSVPSYSASVAKLFACTVFTLLDPSQSRVKARQRATQRLQGHLAPRASSIKRAVRSRRSQPP